MAGEPKVRHLLYAHSTKWSLRARKTPPGAPMTVGFGATPECDVRKRERTIVVAVIGD